MDRPDTPVPKHRKRWLATANDTNDRALRTTSQTSNHTVDHNAAWFLSCNKVTTNEIYTTRDCPPEMKNVNIAPPSGYVNTHRYAVLRKKYETETKAGGHILPAFQQNNIPFDPSIEPSAYMPEYSLPSPFLQGLGLPPHPTPSYQYFPAGSNIPILPPPPQRPSSPSSTVADASRSAKSSHTPSTDSGILPTDITVLEYILGHSINSEKAYWRVRKGQGIQNLHAEMRKREDEIWDLVRTKAPGWGFWGSDDRDEMKDKIRRMIGFDVMRAEEKKTKPNDHPKQTSQRDLYIKATDTERKALDEARRSEANHVAMLKLQEIMAEGRVAREKHDAQDVERKIFKEKRDAEAARIRKHIQDKREKEQAHAQCVPLAQQKAYEIIAEQRESRGEKEREMHALREREKVVAGSVEQRREAVRLARKKKVEEWRKGEEERRKAVLARAKQMLELAQNEKDMADTAEKDEKKELTRTTGKNVRFEGEDVADHRVKTNTEVPEPLETGNHSDVEGKSGSVDEATSNTTAPTQNDARTAAQATHIPDEQSEDDWEAIEDDDKKEWEIINALEEW
ncbi:hypothetical protein BKA63DRAFT_549809 [Paraphoma chrysanthemicola]|nr:hypothetical protein BKA63DRAFT_549809 [Paraphoma chrysanthemicola]